MDTIMPSKDGLNYVVCENIREEIARKFTLVGVYPGYEIFVARKENQTEITIPSLALYFSFTNGQGTFLPVLRLLDPEDEEVVLHKFSSTEKKPGAAMNFVAEFFPFKFKKAGTYTAELTLNDNAYKRQFRITIEEPKTNESTTKG